jgi:hypothetical protein
MVIKSPSQSAFGAALSQYHALTRTAGFASRDQPTPPLQRITITKKISPHAHSWLFPLFLRCFVVESILV